MDEVTAALKAIRDMSSFVSVNGVLRLLNHMFDSYALNLYQSISQLIQNGFPAMEWSFEDRVLEREEYVHKAKLSYDAILSLKLPEGLRDLRELGNCLGEAVAPEKYPGSSDIEIAIGLLYKYYARLMG